MRWRYIWLPPSDKDVQVLPEAAALGFGQKLKRED